MTAVAAPLKKYLGQVTLPEAGTVGQWKIQAPSEDDARSACLRAAQPVIANVSGADPATATVQVAEITRTYRRPRGWTVGHDDGVACPHRDLSVCPACAAQYADRLVEVFGTHSWMTSDAERTLLLASIAEIRDRYEVACEICDGPCKPGDDICDPCARRIGAEARAARGTS